MADEHDDDLAPEVSDGTEIETESYLDALEDEDEKPANDVVGNRPDETEEPIADVEENKSDADDTI